MLIKSWEKKREKERNSNYFRLTFFFVMVCPQRTVFKNANKSVWGGWVVLIRDLQLPSSFRWLFAPSEASMVHWRGFLFSTFLFSVYFVLNEVAIFCSVVELVTALNAFSINKKSDKSKRNKFSFGTAHSSTSSNVSSLLTTYRMISVMLFDHGIFWPCLSSPSSRKNGTITIKTKTV